MPNNRERTLSLRACTPIDNEPATATENTDKMPMIFISLSKYSRNGLLFNDDMSYSSRPAAAMLELYLGEVGLHDGVLNEISFPYRLPNLFNIIVR